MKTTIQISAETLGRLKESKRHPKESYDEVLNYLLDDVEDDTLTAEEIDDLKIALEEVKQGKTIPLEQVAKQLGVQL